ncbi:cupin domain-containing protein [Flavobacterium rhizosphaerae]|uniref:Cupin domain-containing protein n=1 Tax=Flavobacterium rhizosphaerae TaxID=3163298 RepID=A0ABW8YV61_9FLAO
METQHYNFQDDGHIPNSVFPAVVYKKAFSGDNLAEVMERHFAGNNWTNSWRNGVYPYHHYHSITHEVLGVYSGTAELQLGGEKGKKIAVAPGDVMILPAGTGHKKISASADFGVVGAYPNGSDYDIMKGEPGERPAADERIARVPFPENDPVQGNRGGIIELWK